MFTTEAEEELQQWEIKERNKGVQGKQDILESLCWNLPLPRSPGAYPGRKDPGKEVIRFYVRT